MTHELPDADTTQVRQPVRGKMVFPCPFFRPLNFLAIPKNQSDITSMSLNCFLRQITCGAAQLFSSHQRRAWSLGASRESGSK